MLVYPASRKHTLCYLDMAREDSRWKKGLFVAILKAETPKIDHKGDNPCWNTYANGGSGRNMDSVGR